MLLHWRCQSNCREIGVHHMSVNMRSGVLLPIQTHATLPHPEKKVLRVTMTKISHHWCPTATAEEILSSWHPISSTQLCKARVLIKLPKHAHASRRVFWAPVWSQVACALLQQGSTSLCQGAVRTSARRHRAPRTLSFHPKDAVGCSRSTSYRRAWLSKNPLISAARTSPSL